MPRNMTVKKPYAWVVGLEGDGDIPSRGKENDISPRGVDKIEVLVAIDGVEDGLVLS